MFHHLIAADTLLDKAENRRTPYVEALTDDYDFDGRPEVQLANDRLVALLAPAKGGRMYELDLEVDQSQSVGHARPSPRGLPPQHRGRSGRREERDRRQ
ncbi:MAG: DUF1926 domain-containing protein [Pirellulales bacterium]